MTTLTVTADLGILLAIGAPSMLFDIGTLRRPRTLVTFSEFLTATTDRRMSPQRFINRLDFTTTRKTHGFDDDGTFLVRKQSVQGQRFLLMFLLQFYHFGPLCFKKVLTTFLVILDKII